MLETLLQWETLQKVVLNTLLVSIPEEFFLVMFTLVLMGEFDYWKHDEYNKVFYKWDYIRVFVPTIVGALSSNVLRYLGFDFGFYSFLPILIFFILIIFTNDIFGDASALKWIGKAFVFLILGFIVVLISEFTYIPVILYSSGLNLTDINDNILLNFFVSIPSRVTQYVILFSLIIKKRALLKVNFVKPIFENRTLTIITFLTLVLHFTFFIIMMKIISYDKVLIDLPIGLSLVVILSVCISPIINIACLIWGIYFMKNNEATRQKQIHVKLGNILTEIKSYTNNEKYDNIKWKLNQINLEIESLAENLQEKGG